MTEPDPYTIPLDVPVREALRRVMLDVGAIGKDRKMTDGPAKYPYRSIDDILPHVQAAFIRHGVITAPRQTKAVYDLRQTKSGSNQQWVGLTVEWIVKGPDGSVFTGPDGELPATTGEANDTSDKASNKAHTAAWKILLCELLAIPYSSEDQDDTRHDNGGPPAPTVAELWDAADAKTQATAADLEARLDNLPEDLCQRALDRASEKSGVRVYGVTDLAPAWLDWWANLLDKAYAAMEKPEPLHDDAAQGGAA